MFSIPTEQLVFSSVVEGGKNGNGNKIKQFL